eukprot:3115161-Alexandrium_andersonii.AAC.1
MAFAGFPPQTRIPSGPWVITGTSSSTVTARAIGAVSRSTGRLPRSTCSGGCARKKQCVMYNASGMCKYCLLVFSSSTACRACAPGSATRP